MKPPFYRNVSSKYGPSMGRPSDQVTGEVFLARVPSVDGDYDPGGAYWGSGVPVWCAWNEEGEAYLRAASKESAKAKLEGCTFKDYLGPRDLETVTNAYIDCLLWASTGDDGEPLDSNHGPDDISPEVKLQAQKVCAGFLAAVSPADIADLDDGRIGHTFFLAHNGHGVCFMDDLEGDVGERVNTIARTFDEVSPYVGDDGMIYS